ncbi:MAG: glycoside hydrolase family 28 protein, partial [Phycisphaerae bacterium]|nr:glycoside hydrolase family 28 protein [Phycisphaerae bacterium]
MFRHGLILSMGIALLWCLPTQAKIYDITDFGAISNKAADNTGPIRKAIASCAAAGGGTVYVPAGDYGCGGLQLKSNVALHL